MRRIWGALLLCVLCAPVLWAQGPVTPAAAVTSSVYDGTTPLLPKFRLIDTAVSGDTVLVTAVTDKKIRVVAAHLTMTGTAVTIRFESGSGGQALTGQMTPTQGSSIVLPFNPVGWFETSTNQDLNLELGGGQSVDGSLVYVEVP